MLDNARHLAEQQLAASHTLRYDAWHDDADECPRLP